MVQGSFITPWFSTAFYYGKVVINEDDFWTPNEIRSNIPSWTSTGSASVANPSSAGSTSAPAAYIFTNNTNSPVAGYGTVLGYGNTFPDDEFEEFAKSMEGVWEFSNDTTATKTVEETWGGLPC